MNSPWWIQLECAGIEPHDTPLNKKRDMSIRFGYDVHGDKMIIGSDIWTTVLVRIARENSYSIRQGPQRVAPLALLIRPRPRWF